MSALAPPPAFDEALGEDGALRPAYAELARRLGRDPLALAAVVDRRLGRRPLGDAARIVPVPLALDDREFRGVVRAGVAQRARALAQLFAELALGAQGTAVPLADEVLASEGTAREELRWRWCGRGPGAVAFAYAADLARAPDGRWLVLEDNVGCVGGSADAHAVLGRWAEAAGLGAEVAGEPDLVRVLGRRLARLGVEPGDPGAVALVADEGPRSGTREDRRRAALARRAGLRVLAPEALARTGRPRTVANLGAHGPATRQLLRELFEEWGVPLLNAPGTGVLGNKALLTLVGDLIRARGERPLLEPPPTVLLRHGPPEGEPADWVVKPAAGCGGSGVAVLRALPPEAREAVLRDMRGSGRAAVAQRHVEGSRLRAPAGELRVELRAFAYALGNGEIVPGEQAIARVVPADDPGALHNVSRGAAYAPVVRVALSPRARRA